MISVFRNPSRLQANLLLVVAAFIWGTAFVAQSAVTQYHLAFLYNAASFGLAGLILIPLVKRKPTRAQWRWMILGGALLFGGSAFQQVGMFYTKVANASFLTALYVVFTPIILFVGFREKPSWLEFLAVALAVVGAFLLATGGEFHSQWGDVLEAIGAFFWALHIVMLGKMASRFDSISFAFGQFLVCGLLNLAVGIFWEDPRSLFLMPVVASTLYRAVLSIAIGYTIQIWAQRFTPPTDAGLIFALEAVFAALVAWLILSESLQFSQVIGCGLILLAAALAQIRIKS